MSREIMIIAKDKSGVISNNIVKIGENGEHIVIKGTKDTFYEIKDMATNRAPDQIYTKRFKNDLKLKINPKGGALDGVGEADVTIENYCANGNCEIVGVHETGEYYQYVPQSGDADLGTTKMADGEFAYQSLGTVEARGFSPLSALPLAGLAGLGGGGGGTKPDTTAPDAPNLTMVTDNYDAQIGNPVWGSDVDTGSWSIDSATGNISISGLVNVTSDGKIITNDNTPTFSGTGEAGTTVKIYDGDPDNPSNLVGETIVANDGTWTLATDELQDYAPVSLTYDDSALQNIEHILNITLTDTAGNVSDPAVIDIIVDTGYPLRNGETLIEDINGRNSRSSDLDGNEFLGENYYFTNEITLSDDYLKQLYNSPENIPFNEGDSIYITFINRTTGETYLIGGPDGPSVVVGSDGKWSVSIYNTDTLDGTTNAATAYNTAAMQYETLSDGTYEIDVLVYEPSGNTRAITIADLAIDTTAPAVNNVEYVGTSNNISSVISSSNVTIGGIFDDYHQLQYVPGGEDGDGIMERDQDYLVGTGPAEIFIYRDGVEVGSKYVGTDVDTYNDWSFAETLSNGVYKYQVDTMDVAGNTSGLGDSFWAIVDNGNTNNYDLTEVDTVNGKDFENMILVGDADNETFTLDDVGFKSIDGGTGTDTFTLLGSGQILDIAKTTNFEVYNINGNMLTINGDVNANSDHIIINGTSSAVVDLSTDWSSAGTTQTIGSITYNVYSNNGSDDLWIQDTAVVNI